MALRPFAASLCCLLLAASAQAQLSFDLERINNFGNPSHPGITFAFHPVSSFPAEGAGITAADLDNDGLIDLFFCGTEGQPNELYLNNGDGTFSESAFTRGVDEPAKRRGNSLAIDYDNDGDLDLLTLGYPSEPVQNLDLYSFFRNDGAPGFGFTDVTAGVGGFVLGPTSETTTVGEPGGASSADYDADGFADVIVTYWHRNTTTTGYSDDQFRVWHNQANPVPSQGEPDYSSRLWIDRTLETGLDGVGMGWIWTPSFVDIDRDGLMDLHINIETNEDELRLNQGDGTFGPNIATDIGMNFNGPEPQPGGAWGHEMGKAVADMDNDGDLDFYLTNPGTSLVSKKDAFYRNDSDLALGGSGLGFLSIGPSTEVTTLSDGVGWGVSFPDLDNDGDLDLITARGLGPEMATNNVWENLFPATAGADGAVDFQEITDLLPDFGATLDVSRGLVAVDFDNDGDLDAVTTRSGAKPPQPGDMLDAVVYRNTLSNANAWLELDLVEAGGSLNTAGARVFVRTGGVGGPVQMQEVRMGGSFLSQEPARLHFGLGAAGEADYVLVRWFDGALGVLRSSIDNLSGLVEIQRGPDVATGDLDADGLLTGNDLKLLVLGLTDEAAVDAKVPTDWPWRLTGDIDGNGLLDARDFALLRPMLPQTFVGLGSGLPGTNGRPTLSGSGSLMGGSPASVTLTNGLANSSSWLIVGFDLLVLPFKGGVLIPTIDVEPIGPVPTDANGAYTLATTWPNGLPPGVLTQYQAWVADPAAPAGFSASNGLSSITP